MLHTPGLFLRDQSQSGLSRPQPLHDECQSENRSFDFETGDHSDEAEGGIFYVEGDAPKHGGLLYAPPNSVVVI